MVMAVSMPHSHIAIITESEYFIMTDPGVQNDVLFACLLVCLFACLITYLLAYYLNLPKLQRKLNSYNKNENWLKNKEKDK